MTSDLDIWQAGSPRLSLG